MTGEIPLPNPLQLPLADAAAAARAAATPTPPPTPVPTTTAASRPTTSTPRPAPMTPRTIAKPAPAPQAAVEGSSSSTLGQRIVATARTYFGIPYVWGGTTRAGLDCSGLTSLVLRSHGYSPPRTAAQQAAWTTRIPTSQARPGDLVFAGSPAYHVGIYIGGNKMIDSATFGLLVGERPILPGAYFGRIP